jgi:hypothetical protein
VPDEYHGFFGEEVAVRYDEERGMFDPAVVIPVVDLLERFSSQHFVFEDGRVRAFPVEFRYAWPAELDLMARIAGLELRDRWGGWRWEPFTDFSSSHISVYTKTGNA